MTDEQIKQNAEAYADKLVERDYHEDLWLDLRDAYIAGAHSRDEELLKLCNPWISVKERLPEEGADIIYLLSTGRIGRVRHYKDFDVKWYQKNVDHWRWYRSPVRYWQYVKYPKGGEK